MMENHENNSKADIGKQVIQIDAKAIVFEKLDLTLYEDKYH